LQILGSLILLIDFLQTFKLEGWSSFQD